MIGPLMGFPHYVNRIKENSTVIAKVVVDTNTMYEVR